MNKKSAPTRPHGGAARSGLTLKAVRKAGVTRHEAKKDGLIEPRHEYLNRAETRRQEILRLRAEGKTIRAIAEDLDVSVGTVHRHIKPKKKDDEGKTA